MTIKHQNGVSPPLAAIEHIIADLLIKRLAEDERAVRLEKQLNESLYRRDMLDNTIQGLSNEYGVKDINHLFPEQSPAKSASSNTNQEALPSGLPQQLAFNNPLQNEEWVKPNGSWLNFIKKAIRHIDNFVSSQDVMDYLNMNEDARKKHHQTISGTSSAYRDAGQLVGVPIYKRTVNGKIISQYLTGVPEFFENPETKQLKGEYEEKLIEKAQSMGFHTSEADAMALCM